MPNHTRRCVCISVTICVCMCLYVSVCVQCTRTRTYLLHKQTHTGTQAYVRTPYAYKRTPWAHRGKFTRMCSRHIQTYTNVHTRICLCAHAHMHADSHIFCLSSSLLLPPLRPPPHKYSAAKAGIAADTVVWAKELGIFLFFLFFSLFAHVFAQALLRALQYGLKVKVDYVLFPPFARSCVYSQALLGQSSVDLFLFKKKSFFALCRSIAGALQCGLMSRVFYCFSKQNLFFPLYTLRRSSAAELYLSTVG